MRNANTETVTRAAINLQKHKAGELSTFGQGDIYSYQEKIATQTGYKTWKVAPAGQRSVTTSKHANGVARFLESQGHEVTRENP